MHYLVALENRALKLVERPNHTTNNAYEDCGRLEEGCGCFVADSILKLHKVWIRSRSGFIFFDSFLSLDEVATPFEFASRLLFLLSVAHHQMLYSGHSFIPNFVLRFFQKSLFSIFASPFDSKSSRADWNLLLKIGGC